MEKKELAFTIGILLWFTGIFIIGIRMAMEGFA